MIIRVAGVNDESTCDIVWRSIPFRSCLRCLMDNAAFGTALTLREGVSRTFEVHWWADAACEVYRLS